MCYLQINTIACFYHYHFHQISLLLFFLPQSGGANPLPTGTPGFLPSIIRVSSIPPLPTPGTV